MNRRGFFYKLGLATAAFAILPSATTYERIWKPTAKTWVLNPEYETAQYEVIFNERDFAGTWRFLSFEYGGQIYMPVHPRIELITTPPPL